MKSTYYTIELNRGSFSCMCTLTLQSKLNKRIHDLACSYILF